MTATTYELKTSPTLVKATARKPNPAGLRFQPRGAFKPSDSAVDSWGRKDLDKRVGMLRSFPGTLTDRETKAAYTVLSTIGPLLDKLDKQRVEDIIQAHIAAAMPLQDGAREQAQVAGLKIQSALVHIAMLTAREVGEQSGSRAARPESLAAQWVSRKQIFGVELAGHGVRYPAFQFQPSGRPWPALAHALPKLLKEFAPLYLLLWFDAPHPAIESKAPRDVVHDEATLELVMRDSLRQIDHY